MQDEIIQDNEKILSNQKTKLGGEGIVLEVDKSKFGHRKYNRGRIAGGVWILGLIERTPLRRTLMIAIQKKNAKTLRKFIMKYVERGSIVHSDGWRGYCGLENFGYTHLTVNHKYTCVEPLTGCYNNAIKALKYPYMDFTLPRFKNLPIIMALYSLTTTSSLHDRVKSDGWKVIQTKINSIREQITGIKTINAGLVAKMEKIDRNVCKIHSDINAMAGPAMAQETSYKLTALKAELVNLGQSRRAYSSDLARNQQAIDALVARDKKLCSRLKEF